MSVKTAIFLLLCFLLLLPNMCEAEEALNCRITKVLPVKLTSQGMDAKCAINYESAGGDICALYRVRNLPAHPATPVLWKTTTHEILMDVQIPACPPNTVCPWITVNKMGPEFEMGRSVLVYGKGGDSHSDTVQAFIDKVGAKVVKYQTSLTTVIEDSQGKYTEFGIEAASKVEGTGPYRLTYRLSLVGRKHQVPGGAREAVAGRARRLAIWSPAVKKPKPEELTVGWRGVTQRFYAGAGKMVVLELTEDSPEVAVIVTAKAIKLAPVSLVIRAGGQQLAATTAAAYLPLE